jgi:hypothetical protein
MENTRKRKRILKVARLVVAILVVAILVVSAIAETIFYYNSKITNLNSQNSNLKGQIANLETPYLVTALGIGILPDSTFIVNGENVTSNNLCIYGNITNEGLWTAYNVGLHVFATDAFGTTVINMTVPISVLYRIVLTNETLTYPIGSSLPRAQSATVNITILCQGVPVKWTVTPVCTNSP